MSKYVIDGTTLSAIANAIREKNGITGEIILNESTYTSADFNQFDYDNGVTEMCVDLLDEGPVMDSQNFYQVTFNGTSYFCQPWVRWDGELCIGDSRLTYSPNDVPYNDHPEDVPFAIVGYYYNDDNGSGGWGPINEWGVWSLFTATKADCAIKIEKFTSPIEPISVSDYADAINNIPTGKTTKTINIDWSSDYEQTAQLSFYDENFILQTAYNGNFDIIEAQGGIILVRDFHIAYMTDNFIHVPDCNVYIATADNETIGLDSSGNQ